MPAFLLYPLSFLGVLGFLIIVHEWGHYAAAKLLGVRVEVFSVGFGPRILGFRRGETDYRVSLIPLGGYVKMSGENPMDERTDDPAEFMAHPRWHRFLIAAAGPFMNIVLAIGLLTAVYMKHYDMPVFFDQPAVLGWVEPDGAAAKAGLQAGDRITALGSIQNPTWETVFYKELYNANQPLAITAQRATQTLSVTVTPDSVGTARAGDAGWSADYPLKITALEAGMPAEKAGMRLDDEVVSVNGAHVGSMPAMLRSLQDGKGQPVQLSVLRNGQPINIVVQPKLIQTEGHPQPIYRIGMASNPEKVKALPIDVAFQKSLQYARTNSFLLLDLIGKLVQRKVSIQQMDGPLRIGQEAGRAAKKKGWIPLMELTAAISLQLGLFNLMPIPILDGGMILFLLIEGLLRRDVSLPIKERIYQVAFVCLILFASVVLFNDVSKVFFSGGRVP
jgi:regulator of sigma E protease